MEANNFEQNTKIVFDEFVIQPSDKVWTAIEEKISKKNTSFFNWLPVSCCCIIFILSGLSVHDVSIKKSFKPKPQATNNHFTTNPLPNALPKIITKNIATLKNKHLKIKSSHSAQSNVPSHLYTLPPINTIVSKKNKQFIQVQKQSKTNNQLVNNEMAETTNNATDNNLINSNTQLLQNQLNDSITQANKLAIVNAEKPTDVLNNITKPDTVKHGNKQVQLLPQKWKFGISLQVGVSSLNKGLFNNNVSNNNSYANTTSGIGSVTNNTNFSTALKPGTALSIGAIAQYNFSAKNSICLGIQYTYTSTTFKINWPNNSVASLADASVAKANNYVNQFHAIELPFNYGYSIIKNNRVKWQLQVGGQITQFIQIKAMQFNAIQGVFYNDNSMFAKTNVNAVAAIYYNIAKGKNGAWLIGPTFSYGITPFSNQGYYKQMHQNIIGINIQKYFSK